MMALLGGYLYTNQREAAKFQQQKRADSIQNALKNPQPQAPVAVADTNKATPAVADSGAAEATYQLTNKDVAFTFSNKGAMPVAAKLARFKTATPESNRQDLYVIKPKQHEFDLSYNTATGTVLHTKDVVFTAAQNAKSITFTSPQGLNITYTLPDTGYVLDINVNAGTTLGAGQSMNVQWNQVSPNNEYNAVDDQQYTQIVYNENDEGIDYNTINSEKKLEFAKGVKWLSYKQHYFNATLMSTEKPFVKGTATAKPTADTSNASVAAFTSALTLPAANIVNLKLFAGPNDYEILKAQGADMQEIIPYGYGFLSFVKYINKWFMMPIFKFLSKFFSNWGVVIMLLTIIVRLVTSPLIYKSYVSGAKMKALKPEMDKLKASLGDDQQAYAMKSMELQRSAGVNPLGGCLPALLQLPIFFALLSLFPNAIELRQQSFLWTKDLSTFDSIAKLPDIPFYGDHVSLWTLIFVATQLFLALYSMNMANTGDQNNPALKYLPFIMPIMFLGIFNKLPAALTFYYCVSNVITIILQIVIQKFIINEDKLRAQLAENMSKAPKQNKLMEKLMEAQKQKLELEKQRKK
ncbi:MAG: hypothetical protein RL660_2880 [Bacteroidota bacterium]